MSSFFAKDLERKVYFFLRGAQENEEESLFFSSFAHQSSRQPNQRLLCGNATMHARFSLLQWRIKIMHQGLRTLKRRDFIAVLEDFQILFIFLVVLAIKWRLYECNEN